MIGILYALLLWIWDHRSYEVIQQSNEARQKAVIAYQQGDFVEAAKNYEIIVGNATLTEPEARLNLAHAYFGQKKYVDAKKQYSNLLKVENDILASQSQTQLAVIATIEKDTSSAIELFKKALITNPDNDVARYNFELLKKQFKGQTKPINLAQNNIIQQPKSVPEANVSNEVLKTEQQKQILQRLRNMGMNEARALAILDAMRAAEIQFLQQQKKQKTTSTEYGSW
jgi:tetratricopeptide (TPR) repeat protein